MHVDNNYITLMQLQLSCIAHANVINKHHNFISTYVFTYINRTYNYYHYRINFLKSITDNHKNI
jgi:hypothetical protein